MRCGRCRVSEERVSQGISWPAAHMAGLLNLWQAPFTCAVEGSGIVEGGYADKLSPPGAQAAGLGGPVAGAHRLCCGG